MFDRILPAIYEITLSSIPYGFIESQGKCTCWWPSSGADAVMLSIGDMLYSTHFSSGSLSCHHAAAKDIYIRTMIQCLDVLAGQTVEATGFNRQ